MNGDMIITSYSEAPRCNSIEGPLTNLDPVKEDSVMAKSNIPQTFSYRKLYYLNNRDKELERNREWDKLNRDKRRAYALKYYHKNKVEINSTERSREYRKKNPEYAKEYYQRTREKRTASRREYYKNHKQQENSRRVVLSNQQYRIDPRMKIRQCIAARIRKSLKLRNVVKQELLEILLGYSIERLQTRLIKTIPNGYTWDDFLSGKLHIDHIIPIAAFNFESHNDPDFKRCWALSNLQLLPAEENLKKGAKILYPFQPNLGLAVNQ